MVVQTSSHSVDLFSLVRNNEVKAIEALQPGIDLNVTQRGQTPLILAIQEKKDSVINVSDYILLIN